MNIAIDIRCLSTSVKTGVPRFTVGALDSLFKIDKKNQYFLFYNSWKDVSKNIPKWNQKNVNYVISKLPNKFFHLLLIFRLITLDKYIEKKIEKKIDLFFSPNLHFGNISKNVNHIITIHDLAFYLFPKTYTLKGKLWHKFTNPIKQCKNAKSVVVPSKNTKRDIVKWFKIKEEKIKILHPGLSLKNKSFDNNFKFKKPYILCLGTIEPRKNIISSIEAYNLLPKKIKKRYDLVVAGPKGWKYKNILKKIKDNAGVKYIGKVSEKEKTNLFKNATVFLYPSLYEGFGFPILEAFSAGTPVITSSRSSLPEVAKDAALLVHPRDINEMSSALKNFLNNKKLRDTYIKKGNKQVEKFSWDIFGKKLFKLFISYENRN